MFLSVLLTSIFPTHAFTSLHWTQDSSSMKDPSPGEYETSEYLIGSIAVGVIFLESNGKTDPNTENWTSEQETQTLSKIQHALEWWASQNPTANVTFKLEIHYKAPTSYEPITRPYKDRNLWVNEVMNYLGYNVAFFETQERRYINDLRETLRTDWAFMIFIVNAFNDVDGEFSDGQTGSAFAGGPSLTVPATTFRNMGWAIAHEVAHIFWATDEYDKVEQYSGYLNVPDVDGSGCLMEKWNSWNLSGKPHGLNGTWGQIGWRDNDGDGIQDIVDTAPSVALSSCRLDTLSSTFECTGRANTNPYPNYNPRSIFGNSVTINKIQTVQFRVDDEKWMNAKIISATLKEVGMNRYVLKNTAEIVNFTFTTPYLQPGKHLIEIKATDQWGNTGHTRQAVTVPGAAYGVAVTKIEPYRNAISNNTSTSINVTVQNHGDATENFSLTVDVNSTIIENRAVSLDSGDSATLTFSWNTVGLPLGKYAIKATASTTEAKNETSASTLTYSPILVSIMGDINADGTVNILDISIAAKPFNTMFGDKRWNANADINEDRIINMVDVTLVTKEFGKIA